MHLSEMRALLSALRAQGDTLRERQQDALSNPESDEGRAVLFGLASRLFRLLHDFLERPSSWTAATAPFHLRALLDTRILSGWLIARNDAATFAAYREHGLGRLKLLRDHVKADFGDEPEDYQKAFLEYLDRRVNLEIDELWQPVHLGNIERKSVRDMAAEAGLEREYKLAYAPYSSSSHGEWPVVREQDTLICEEPLHAGHRLGAFTVSPREVSADFPMTAFEYASAGIDAIFRQCAVEPPSWEPVEVALRAALYLENDPGDQATEPTT